MADSKLFEIDLYELFGLTPTCSVQELKKAYRKKALTCHPDKNPDNPKAGELFRQLAKALEILIDDSARAAYNKVLNGRKAAKIRHSELDSKRKKLKEDLEERERLAAQSSSKRKQNLDTRTDEEKLQAEIDRLRKEGSKQVEEEIAYVRRQVEEEQKLGGSFNSRLTEGNSNRLKVRWHSAKDDSENGGYNHDILNKILCKYGDIVALIISKKKGSAMVEFKTEDSASTALQFEKGFITNPLVLECIGGLQPQKHARAGAETLTSASLVSDNDYENLVLRRMRQAQERQKLIDEIKDED